MGQSFLSAENFKRVFDAAAEILSREHAFRVFGAAPPAILRSLATDAMRAAMAPSDPLGPTNENPFEAAVFGLVESCKAKFHLERASVMADYERATKDRSMTSLRDATVLLTSETPPPPITEAELRDRLRERDRVVVSEEPINFNNNVPSVEPFQTLANRAVADRATGDRGFANKAYAGNAGHVAGQRGHGEKHGERHAGAVSDPTFTDQLHHVVVSSIDRDWAGACPMRYKYQVQLDHKMGAGASLNMRLRNIVSVEIDYIIIPTEIVLNRQDTSTDALAYRHRNLYENSYSFNFPYMIVQAEEFQNFYHGTNDIIRKAFSVVSHSSSFDDVNGRNYEILRPVSGAKHEFRPPLAGLTSLTLSLLMPNGALLNTSVDGRSVLSVTWSNARHTLVKITTRFFDRNEFYVGDYIQFSGFSAPPGAPETAVTSVSEFLLASTGHQVYDMGDLNTDAYYNSFYVRAPGAFDNVAGAYVVDPVFLASILLVQPSPTTTTTVDVSKVLNLSLQNTLHLKVTTEGRTSAIEYDLV